jgi:putative hydrolase of the HAD superfamily
MNTYKCIFFDLDHTLWDYETNSKEALQELFDYYALAERGVTNFDAFHCRFKEVNAQLWDLYDRDLITSDVIRKERFKQVLQPFGAHEDRFSEDLSKQYLSICPLKGYVMPNARETIAYLANHYSLTVVTNGFDEIQQLKLASAKLDHFFDHIVTSQKAGCKKPAKGIFEFAMGAYAIRAHEAIMIGDNLITDIGGARNASIDNVYFNPDAIVHNEAVNYEIKNLNELCTFL